MIIWTFTLLQIIVLTNAGFTAKEFINVGSFRSQRGSLSKNGQIPDENNYFVSASNYKVIWNNAQQTCKNIFGTNSSTVSIESQEEWDFLKVMLESYGTIETYWTSGMYDRSSNVWRWSSNNAPIMSWAPWESGYPSTNPTGLHRVLIVHANRNEAVWRTTSNSQLHRFICKVPQSTPIPFTCYDTDLIIVLDSSASIGSHNYKKAKHFAMKIAEEFTTHDTSRIGFLIYSDEASSIISLNNALDPQEISEVILDAPYLKGSTATHEGINGAITEFINYPRNVTRNIVVVTDGESSNSALIAAAIERADDMGIRTFSVGITPSADQGELLVISNGDEDYVFTTEKCDELISLSEPLTRKICPDN